FDNHIEFVVDVNTSTTKNTPQGNTNMEDNVDYDQNKKEIKTGDFENIKISAKKGDSEALYNSGNCYLNGIRTDKNEKKAFKWYLKSAIGGCAKAQFGLGYCYFNGIGTDKNEKKAFEWYLKSAIAGCGEGQCNLGWYCYLNGIGTDKDEKKAFEWL